MENDEKIFGFWIYLMTDLIIFSVLFAAFIVLHNNTFRGPSSRELFKVSYALAETLLLLTSSFTCAVAMLAVHLKKKKTAIFWFVFTFALGSYFLLLELSEFYRFVQEGASWKQSAFLSSFFTLVGMHGLHISVGLLWMIVSICRIGFYPINDSNIAKILCMALFWHFLDFVWVFIFTVVYCMPLLSKG